MKKINQLGMSIMLICTLLLTNAMAADEFPLRAKYPEVKVISTGDLAKDFSKIIIVDVRSTMEYDVAHANNAKHIPLAKASFTKDLEKVRGKSDTKAMAFYCNGHTCSKSYKAYVKAAKAGFSNIFAYDAGIFDWITSNPDKATLMGETPAPKDKIIPKSELKKRMMSFQDFQTKAQDGNAISIDIRDPFQRKEIPEVAKLRNIPLDKFLNLIKKKKFMDKHLLVLDAVGKQVRWLQYHLEENGYSNYNFLDKGVAGIK